MADGRMSADLNLYGTLSGPSTTDETWSGSLPFYLDDTIPPDCLSLPLFEDNDQWLSPPVPWATGPTLRKIPTASSEASFIAPCQTVHNTTSDYEQKCSPMQATFPQSAPAQTSPTPMHEITSRGSIMSVSSGGSADNNQSGFSIPSYSSSNGSPVYGRRGSSRRPPSQGFEVNERERRKRERFLERNRVAANKCRKKKKEHANQLESRFKTVSRENKLLESQADHLRSEILNLKSELLRHSHCGDERIKCHLAKLVKQLSDKTGTTA
ncbi:transcriptional regulator family: bZIP [Aspergillus niger]|nr:transcriptional regulator family: bZIP [Aspergillus niger]